MKTTMAWRRMGTMTSIIVRLLHFQGDCGGRDTEPNALLTKERSVAMGRIFRKLMVMLKETDNECKERFKKELKNQGKSNISSSYAKERVKRDLYWTRVQAYEFYQEMIHRVVVFEERLNEAIDVSVEDEESPSSEPRGSPRDS
ncbi:hypothetical protein Tco_1514611 [Tanacetum coccineum]